MLNPNSDNNEVISGGELTLLPEWSRLCKDLPKSDMEVLEKVLFENSLEDIFLCLVEVFRADNDWNELKESITILINK